MLARLFGSAPEFRREFDHLIVHSDAQGYYLPIEFDEVLFPPSDLAIPGGMVGSAQRLPIPDGETWQRYGRESFGCVALREGCRIAIASGAALAFT